jgi:hypothetical protein
MTVSSPIKIVALLGIMAACGVFLYMQVLSPGGSSSDSAVAPVIKPLHPVKAHITTLTPTKPAAKKVTAVKVTAPHKKVTAVKVTAPHKKVTAVKVQPKPAAKVVAAAPAAATPTPTNGLPPRVAEALREFPVVVVALYSPEASVDATSLGEAAAGAKAAKVGFLAINVLDQAQVSPFTDAFGVLQDPTLLIYARPGTLTFKVDGFADRQVVAQAALSAKRTA